MFPLILFTLIGIAFVFLGAYLFTRKEVNPFSFIIAAFGSVLIFVMVFTGPTEVSWGYPSFWGIDKGDHPVQFAVAVDKTVFVGVLSPSKTDDQDKTVRLYRFSREVFTSLNLNGKTLSVFDEVVSVSGYPSETKVTVRRLSLE